MQAITHMLPFCIRSWQWDCELAALGGRRAFLCHSLCLPPHLVLSAIYRKIFTLVVLCKAAYSHAKEGGHSLSELMCSFIASVSSCNINTMKNA